ncbi:MAG TPA: hypothetical protein VMF89_12600, partial [Polyangiales bacterium]|nr:hypothetical protein [Polyangiales bacterium]
MLDWLRSKFSPVELPSTPPRAALADEADAGSWVSVAACIAAATTLGLALQIADGAMHPDALAGVTRTLVWGGLAVLAPRVAP